MLKNIRYKNNGNEKTRREKNHIVSEGNALFKNVSSSKSHQKKLRLYGNLIKVFLTHSFVNQF